MALLQRAPYRRLQQARRNSAAKSVANTLPRVESTTLRTRRCRNGVEVSSSPFWHVGRGRLRTQGFAGRPKGSRDKLPRVIKPKQTLRLPPVPMCDHRKAAHFLAHATEARQFHSQRLFVESKLLLPRPVSHFGSQFESLRPSPDVALNFRRLRDGLGPFQSASRGQATVHTKLDLAFICS